MNGNVHRFCSKHSCLLFYDMDDDDDDAVVVDGDDGVFPFVLMASLTMVLDQSQKQILCSVLCQL